ncbi:dienelactone hydrolase family protein, partial [Vibrio antiquarius]|nr:dienelactone hydrolase family protein [Vibrio antiquarius]
MVLKHSNSNNKASHPIPQEAFDWYDEYAHGKISRREFLNRLGGLAVLGFSMTALVDALTPNYALAEQVSFNDPEIKATYETFASPNGHGEGSGYLVVPQKKTLKSPTVLVIHE